MRTSSRLTLAALAALLVPVALPTAAAGVTAPAHAVVAATTTPAPPEDSTTAPGEEPPAAEEAGAAPLTWSIAPATPEGADGRVSFRLELEPGATHTDHVAVTNYSDQQITFDLDASDGVVTEDGLFDLLPSSEAPVGTGSWIEIQDEVTVEPQDSVVVPFTLTVPDDALPGDHPGGIAAGIATVGQDAAGNEVSLDARVGARIHLRVAGELVPQVSITGLDASYETSWNPFAPGVLNLEWTVENGGNVRLGAEQMVAVLGRLGLDPGVVDQVLATQREILPGQSATASASLEAWPTGQLTAVLTSSQNVVGDDVVDAELPTAQAQTTVWALPWPLLVIVVALAALVVGALWLRRRRRRSMALALAAARAEGAREAGAPVEGGAGGEDAGGDGGVGGDGESGRREPIGSGGRGGASASRGGQGA